MHCTFTEDIIGLSETHYNKCVQTTTEEGHGFWFSWKARKLQTCLKWRLEANSQHLICWKKTDNLTGNVHGALVDTRSEVFGKARKKKKPWMTSSILDLCDRRRSLKNRIQEGPLAIQNYREVNQAIGRKMKQAKENWITDRCQEIDCGIRILHGAVQL